MKDTEPFDTDEDDFDTVMADDISFAGTIVFAKPLMIKGQVNGTLESTSDLLIDTKASVRADIVADRVFVRGSVTGNIKGRRLIYVAATGSVQGDISAGQVVLEPGSTFSGKCSMPARA